jgi:protein-tyrosine phosphatase/nicotinamidase-related amidase
MPPALLLTQCLQEDFVGALGPHEPLPNALHIGPAESLRLLGRDPAVGPLASLMHWARARSPAELALLHIRDAHDPADPQQAAHLRFFGTHCLAGSPGARLVLDLDRGAGEREGSVSALTLNDFVGTDLQQRIAALRPSRAAVIGVWTDAKVSFLLYELATRCGITELATCSALTASVSRSQHLAALDQLRRVLGVHVFDSVGELCAWMVPGGPEIALPPLPEGPLPRLEGAPLEGEDRALAGAVYREAARLRLSPIGGGFSGARVFRVQAWDSLGHALAPTVLKLGPREAIATERRAFEQVEGILGNDAPSVRGFAESGPRGALKYAFAAMGSGEVRTFKSLYEEGLPLPEVEDLLERVFEGILGRFAAAAQAEPLPLLKHYTFEARWAEGVRRRVRELLGEDPGERIPLPGGGEGRHPAVVYEQDLAEMDRALGVIHTVAWIHGDLNGANILRDGNGNAWLIDWFHAQRGHAIRDLLKLENDLLYLATPISDEAELVQAVQLSGALRAVRDLRAPLPPLPPQVQLPALRRAWSVLSLLRARVGALVGDDRDPAQVRIGLLRYAVHTMGFEEASPLQRRWALYAASGHAADLLAAAARARRLRVDWLAHPLGERIGLTLCPGRRDRQRDLEADLTDLVEQESASHLLCLLPQAELEAVGVAELLVRARAHGLQVRSHPIRDQGAPDPAELRQTLAWLREAVEAGGRVVVHCLGGLGRSGLVAATALIEAGLAPAEAIAVVRASRDPRAIESQEQEDFVRSWVRGMPLEGRIC